MEYNTKARGRPIESDRCCHRKQDILRWDREKLGVLCCFSTGDERAQSKRRTAASLLLCCHGSSQTTPARDLPKSLIQLHLIYTHAQATALRQGRAVRFHHIHLRRSDVSDSVRLAVEGCHRRGSTSEIIVIIVSRAVAA